MPTKSKLANLNHDEHTRIATPKLATMEAHTKHENTNKITYFTIANDEFGIGTSRKPPPTTGDNIQS